MTAFKVGDKVRCLDNIYAPVLTVGAIYTVARHFMGHVMLTETGENVWSPERFEVVPMTTPPIPPELATALADVYTAEGCRIWWTTRNRGLGSRRPCDVYEADPQAIRELVDTLAGAW